MKKFIEDLKLALMLGFFTIIMPMLAFAKWVHFGY